MKRHYCVYLLTVACLVSCNKHPNFKTSDEAIEADKNFLSELLDKRSVDMDEFTDLTKEWLELRDSSYSAFSRDKTLTLKNPKAMAYFIMSDSIRKTFQKLAFSQPRTMKDVMYYKLNTSSEAYKVKNSETYKEAVEFYKELDDVPTYSSLAKSIQEYEALLQETKGFRTVNELHSFIKEEDRCYRSLMEHLSEVPQSDLEYLSENTTRLLSSLYETIGKKSSDEVDDRVMLYLTMRFNRRVVQNMVACKEDILNQKNLTPGQKASYRWMLIQAFTSLDSYGVACLTKQQKKDLLEIANMTPALLNRIDTKKESDVQVKKMADLLSGYFLKNQVESIL